MKQTIITGTLAIIIILFFSMGCQNPSPDVNVTISADLDVDINPITGEPYHDIIEKRGVVTNITEFDELLKRASTIQSYKYTLTDTATGGEQYKFYTLYRFIKVELPEPEQHNTGEIYDEVIMDRITKQAFSHCSDTLCPTPDLDKELERVEYDEYYVSDPLEQIYKSMSNPEFIHDELLEDQYTKVFSITFESKPARIWLQEYYGFPVKIVVRNQDNSKRIITFDDMIIDSTKKSDIDLPFNSTIKGERGHWWFWEHYLGEWPAEGQKLTPEVQNMLGV